MYLAKAPLPNLESQLGNCYLVVAITREVGAAVDLYIYPLYALVNCPVTSLGGRILNVCLSPHLPRAAVG
jgi:hypothetical protein